MSEMDLHYLYGHKVVIIEITLVSNYIYKFDEYLYLYNLGLVL